MKLVFLNTLDAELAEPLKKFLIQHRDTTDVFCFQEVGDAMQELIKELCADFTQAASSKSILMRDAQFSNVTLVHAAHRIETSTSNTDSPNTGLALLTSVRVKGELVHIANVHGLPRPGKLDTPERVRQSQEILDSLSAAEGATIIGGDFNVLPETESVRMFETTGYKNLIRDFHIKTTRNHIAWSKYPGNELPYSDYVFIKGISAVSFEVPNDIVSDHQPMILVLDRHEV